MGLSDRTKTALAACAEVALPAGARLPGGGESTVRIMEAALAQMPRMYAATITALATAADALALRHGRFGIASLPASKRFALLEAWRTHASYPVRSAYRILLSTLKAAHYSDAKVQARSGCRSLPLSLETEPQPRWMQQVQDLNAEGSNEEIEVDVVIVGSGAGGAAAARILANAGLAVALIEAGPYLRRGDFVGPVLARLGRMYSRFGLQSTVGNVAIPLSTGEVVGGTTTINAGTCLRTPSWILRHWREGLGIPISDEEMAREFERVEGWLEVAVPDASLLGMQAKIIARGADAMGITHGPLPRNAPGCDAQAQCCFGCPQGAKRSADVSLVPAALSAGAVLYCNAVVNQIAAKNGEVRLQARARQGRTLHVKARAGLIAAGSLRTPLLLKNAGVRHPWLGHNLSIHPCMAAVGLFPFDVRMDEAIPQGYGLEGPREHGLMFEGGATPLELTAIGINIHGSRLVEVLERHAQLLTYGFNVRDTSRGHVVRGPDDDPLAVYSLNNADVVQFGIGSRLLIDVLVKGGAEAVFPPIYGLDEVPAEKASHALDGFSLSAGDLGLSAYHPLGTARMGVDPATSVVDMDLRVRGCPELLVVDGAVIPSSLGANPQITIMALAARAADRLVQRLS